MNAAEHKDYKLELERLTYTKGYIRKTLEATEAYRDTSKSVIREALSEMEDQDSSQNYIEVLIHSKMIEMAERNQDGLIKALKKPYFSRIDFKEEGKAAADSIYIGKTSLYRGEDEIPLIVDWRAPIAAVYYEGRLGETEYEAEGDIQRGELLMKRQFTIENGGLTGILDVDITTNDAFLQAALEGSAEDKLKDIAATIQAEQNRVIRADLGRPLIVQGAAGSGKTTIALHRIAYFIYTYEKLFDPESFMIIAPNRLFINYISEVLPELGVEKVVQTTFIDLMAEMVGTKYNLTDPNAKLAALIHASRDGDTQREMETVKWAAAFKGSAVFKDIVEAYIMDLTAQFTPLEDFTFEGHVIVSQEKIEQMILEGVSYLPLYKTVSAVKKSLKNQLQQYTAKLSARTQERYDKQIRKLRVTEASTEERRLKIVALIDRRDKRLETIRNEARTLVRKHMAGFSKPEIYRCYKELVCNEALIHRYSQETLPPDRVAYLCRQSAALLRKKQLELEDYAPLVYLKHRLHGFDGETRIQSVVIDEAQDFSIFQLFALKAVFNTERFTLLGDLSQGIHGYRGIQDWDDVQEQVFTTKTSRYMTLIQSYRTTIEVMDLANSVIARLNNPQIVPACPVIRHGEKPEIISFLSADPLLMALEERIRSFQTAGYKSIAVIGKTQAECTTIQRHLQGVPDIKAVLLGEMEDHYEAGVVIVPSYLAKGLEFDAVLIICLEEQYREEELDIKLLYVAMTRSLHRLCVLHLAGRMPLLEGIENGMKSGNNTDKNLEEIS